MKLTNNQIEQIIEDEITVDCYDEWETQASWGLFMTEGLLFPFKATCSIKMANGKKQSVKVEVVENETTESSFNGRSFYVNVDYNGILIPVKLLDLKDIEADKNTLRTIAVWKYENRH